MKSLKLFTLILFFNISGLIATAQTAHRIVSLAPSLTKVIYLLEEECRLVGCTSFCKTNAADSVNIVGSATDVNIEKAFSLDCWCRKRINIDTKASRDAAEYPVDR